MAGIVMSGIAQEGSEVARGGEAEAAGRRVLGAIDQLVKPAWLKSGGIADVLVVGRRRLAWLADAETPLAVRDRLARILLARPDRQGWQKAVRGGSLIVEARGGIAVVAAGG